ncbi:MAG: hypothetical protein ACR2N2_06180 [Acidimicrobiia bacterium]
MRPLKAAVAIVDAMVKDKSDAVIAKDSLPMTGLSNTPRRVGRTLARGRTFQ